VSDGPEFTSPGVELGEGGAVGWDLAGVAEPPAGLGGGERADLDLGDAPAWADHRGARVKALYATLLGRAPDPAGWDYWAKQVIALGDITLAKDLAASSEYLLRSEVRFP